MLINPTDPNAHSSFQNGCMTGVYGTYSDKIVTLGFYHNMGTGSTNYTAKEYPTDEQWFKSLVIKNLWYPLDFLTFFFLTPLFFCWSIYGIALGQGMSYMNKDFKLSWLIQRHVEVYTFGSSTVVDAIVYYAQDQSINTFKEYFDSSLFTLIQICWLFFLLFVEFFVAAWVVILIPFYAISPLIVFYLWIALYVYWGWVYD